MTTRKILAGLAAALVGGLAVVGALFLLRFSDALIRPPRPTLERDGEGEPLRRGGHGPVRLGVALGEPEPGEAAGLPVRAVLLPAPRAAGLEAGDRLLEADGEPLGKPADLKSIVSARAPGDSLRLRVRSGDGRETRLEVPLTPVPLTPEDLGLPYREVSFSGGEGLTARGWVVPPPEGEACGAAVLMHGNASNRRQGLALAAPLHAAGFALLLFDFTGRGDSEGGICTYGVRERQDALEAARLAGSLAPGRPVVLYGRSLGGSVALLAAAEAARRGAPRVDAVVADSPYAALWELIRRQREAMGLPGWPTDPLFLALVRWRGGFDPRKIDVAAEAGEIAAPVLLLHGEADRVIPPEHSERIAAALPGRATLRLLPALDHNDERPTEEIEAIVAHLVETLGGPPCRTPPASSPS